MLPLGIVRRCGAIAAMTAVLSALLLVPVGAVLAALLFLFGASLLPLVTFGGALNAFQGAAAWWMIGCLPALAYCAYALAGDGRPAH